MPHLRNHACNSGRVASCPGRLESFGSGGNSAESYLGIIEPEVNEEAFNGTRFIISPFFVNGPGVSLAEVLLGVSFALG